MDTISKKRYILIAALWLTYGYLCWLAGVYLFTYGINNFGFPIYRHIMVTFHSLLIKELVYFVYFFIADIVLTFLFALILSRATGIKCIWLLLFIVGAIGYSVYYRIDSHIFYMNYYETLPSWVKTSLIQSAIAYLVVIPMAAWSGAVLGNKFKEKNHNLSLKRGLKFQST